MDEAARIARKLSVLADLGLERVEVQPVASESVPVNRKTHKVICSRGAMGTRVSVSALGPRDRVEEGIGRAFEEMDRLIKLFNRYDGASAVSELNRKGRLADAPPEFSHVVSRAVRYHKLSGGAFDVSVKPLLDLFANGEPDRTDLAAALELVGSAGIEQSHGTVGFKKSGMGMTLDGIAKGYIVDRIAEVLDRYKLRNYLIDAGGDIRARGRKENRQAWTVAVQDPWKQGRFPDVIHLREAAVATSGSYEIYFDRERLSHHIVNAGTGKSPNLNDSVSVVAPTAMVADALATSAFIMGPDDAVELIDSLHGCECLIIDKTGVQLRSRGWRSADHAIREEQ